MELILIGAAIFCIVVTFIGYVFGYENGYISALEDRIKKQERDLDSSINNLKINN
jgi:hypothetical protein